MQYLGIYPEKTIIEKDTCTPIFIAALFTIARPWRQPRHPVTDEWIKKVWRARARAHTHTHTHTHSTEILLSQEKECI